MYACSSVSVACRPAEKRRHVAKLGKFVGEFSWVTGDPIGVKGLIMEKSCDFRRSNDCQMLLVLELLHSLAESSSPLHQLFENVSFFHAR